MLNAATFVSSYFGRGFAFKTIKTIEKASLSLTCSCLIPKSYINFNLFHSIAIRMLKPKLKIEVTHNKPFTVLCSAWMEKTSQLRT